MEDLKLHSEKFALQASIDKLGRLTLPVECCRALGWGKQSRINCFLDGDSVVLMDGTNRCSICESLDDLTHISNQYFCKDCIREVGNFAKGVDEDFSALTKRKGANKSSCGNLALTICKIDSLGRMCSPGSCVNCWLGERALVSD